MKTNKIFISFLASISITASYAICEIMRVKSIIGKAKDVNFFDFFSFYKDRFYAGEGCPNPFTQICRQRAEVPTISILEIIELLVLSFVLSYLLLLILSKISERKFLNL